MSTVPVAVPVAVRRELAGARARGEDFVSAWPAALAAALDGQARWDAQAWRNILSETAEVWRAAFERRTAGPLAAALGMLGADKEVQARLEAECAAPGCRVMVVAERGRGSGARITCSERCRRRAAEAAAADRDTVAA
jgi:hypothetical protein